jgi:FtsH-binding integral membrane protein
LETGPIREEPGRVHRLVNGALIAVAIGAWVLWHFDRVSTRTTLLVVVTALLVAGALFVFSKIRHGVEQPTAFTPLAVLAVYLSIEWVAFEGKAPMWLQVLAILAFLFGLFGDVGPSEASRSTRPDRPRTF